MEFLQRHLPRVYQAVQDALNFFTNVTAQIFGAPPNAPQPRDARTNAPIQTTKESGGLPAQEETQDKKETSQVNSIPEHSQATEENGDSGRCHPGDEDLGKWETDLRHRKSDPGGTRDLEYKIAEGVDIVLYSTVEVTSEIEVIETIESRNIVTVSHGVQSIFNQEQVNPPDLEQENQTLSIACEIKVSQYEEELIPSTENLSDNEPLRKLEHKVTKDKEHVGEPSSDSQNEESFFQSATLYSLSSTDQKQLVDIIGQEKSEEEERKLTCLIEITTESEGFNITTDQEAEVLEESIDSTVTIEYDVDNILDVIETNKKLVTPADDIECPPYSQEDTKKTLEDLVETANRLAKHCDLFKKVGDQKGSDTLPDSDERLGSAPAFILPKGQRSTEEDLTSMDASLAQNTFSIEHIESTQTNLEEETMKAQSLVLEQSRFSEESDNITLEEGKDMTTKDAKVLRETTNKENVQEIEEKLKEKHQFKESETQPKVSKKQRPKRRVHFSPSTEDLFLRKSECASRNTPQMVCDDILEVELQQSRENSEQLGSTYITKDLSPSQDKDEERDYLGVVSCVHVDGQSTIEKEQLNVIEEGRAVWYDDYTAQAEYIERCKSLGDMINQNEHVDFKMEESFVEAEESTSTEEHLDDIPSSEDTLSVVTSKFEQTELSTENKNESHAFQKEVNISEKGSLSASDKAKESLFKEDSFLQEAKSQVNYLLEERTDLLEDDTTYVKESVDDINQSSNILDAKDNGLQKDFIDELKQIDNLELEQVIPGQNNPAEDIDNTQLQIISHFSTYEDITETGSTAENQAQNEFTSDQPSVQKTNKDFKSQQDGAELQGDLMKSFQEQVGSSIVQLEEGTTLGQPFSRNSDDECSEILLETQDSTLVDEICMSVVEDVVLGDGLPSEEHNDVIRDAKFQGESELFDEISTSEMEEEQECMNEQQSYDYKHEGFPPETNESQEEGSKVKTGHIEPLTEQDEALMKSFEEEVGSSIVQLEEDTSLGQPVSRNIDNECSEILSETHFSTLVDGICMSVVEDDVLGDGLSSEEHNNVLRDANLEEISPHELEEEEEYMNEQQNYDNKHEGFPPETNESQEEDRKVKTGHIEPLREQQCIAEEQHVAGTEASLEEGLGNKQMQDDNKECPEESYEMDQSASLNEVRTSMVQDVLIREGLESEECSEIFKDVKFEAQSEPRNETTTSEVPEHTVVKQNDDDTHEYFQLDDRKLQEEDSKAKVGRIDVEFLNGEQFGIEKQLAVHNEYCTREVALIEQSQEDGLQEQPVFRDSDEVGHKEWFETEQSSSVVEISTSIVEDSLKKEDQVSGECNDIIKGLDFRTESEEIMTYEVLEPTVINQNDYIHEPLQPDTRGPPEDDIKVSIGHTEIESLTQEQFVFADEGFPSEGSKNDQPLIQPIPDAPCAEKPHDAELSKLGSDVCTSIAEEILIKDSLAPEDKDVLEEESLKTERKPHSETSACELDELEQHSDSTIKTSKSQGDDSKVNTGHLEVGQLTEEQLVAEEQFEVYNEASVIEGSNSDLFQKDILLGRDVRVIDEQSPENMHAIQLSVSVDEIHTSIAENFLIEDGVVSEEWKEALREEGLEEEGISHSDISTEVEELQDPTAEEQKVDYMNVVQLTGPSKSQEDEEVNTGHLDLENVTEGQIEAGEQFEVYNEASVIEGHNSAYLQKDILLRQRDVRVTDEQSSENLHEMQLSASVDGIHTSIAKNDDGLVSEEWKETLREERIEDEGLSHSDIPTEVKELQDHTAEEQKVDYMNAVQLTGTSKSQEYHSNVNTGHLDLENVTKGQIEAEDQFEVNHESSSKERPSTTEQEDRSPGQPEPRDTETTQSASAFEISTSVVENILIAKSLMLEECSDIIKDPDFKTENESCNETTTYEEQEHKAADQSNDYTHEDSQLDSIESQVKAGHVEVELLDEEQIVAEQQPMVDNEGSATEGSCNDQLPEQKNGQPVSKDKREESHQEQYETVQCTSMVEMCISVVEGVLIKEDLVSEEFSRAFEGANFTSSESHNEISTYEVQENTAVKQSPGYAQNDFQSDASESQVQENIGHMEVEIITEEQLVVTDEACPEEGSSNDQLHKDRDVLCPKILHETEQSALVNEVCTPVAEDFHIRDSKGSQEHTEAGLLQESKSNRGASTYEVDELQKHTAEKNNNDHIYEVALTEDSKPQGNFSDVNTVDLEVENVTEEQFVAEEQFEALDKASLIEGSNIDHLQEDELPQTVSKESDEELYGTESSTTVVKMCTFMVDDILRESLASEELSGIVKDTHFKAESESHHVTTTYDEDHSAKKINHDSTHENFQPKTHQTQQDSKLKDGHTEGDYLTEEQFVVTDETFQVAESSSDQLQEDRLSEEHREVFREKHSNTDGKSDGKTSTCRVEELQEHTAEKYNDNYLYEDFQTETSKSQEEENKAKIGPIECLPKEQLVVEEQLVFKNETSLPNEDEDYTEEEHYSSNDTKDTQEEENKAKIGPIECLPKERLVVEEQLVFKNESSLPNEDEDYTGEEHYTSNYTKDTQEEENKAEIGPIECLPKEQLVVEEQLVLKNESSLPNEDEDYTEEEHYSSTDIKDTQEEENKAKIGPIECLPKERLVVEEQLVFKNESSLLNEDEDYTEEEHYSSNYTKDTQKEENKAKIGPIECLPKERLVVEEQLVFKNESSLPNEDEDYTEEEHYSSNDTKDTQEEENKAKIGPIECLPKEQLVVEEQLVFKNESSLPNEDEDYTEEEHYSSNDTKDTQEEENKAKIGPIECLPKERLVVEEQLVFKNESSLPNEDEDYTGEEHYTSNYTKDTQEEENKAEIGPIECLPKEQLVVEEQLVLKNESSLPNEDEDYTEEEHYSSTDIKDTQEEENKAKIGPIECLPKERLVVEEQLVFKNESSLLNEDEDYTEEEHYSSNYTKDTQKEENKAKIGPIECLPKERLVVEEQLVFKNESSLPNEDEDYTEEEHYSSNDTKDTQEEENKAKIGPIECLPKEQLVVEEQLVFKNESSLPNEDEDYTEEEHYSSNDTKDRDIKDSEEYKTQFEQDHSKLIKESYEEEEFYHLTTNGQYDNTGHTNVLESTMGEENQVDKDSRSQEKKLDLLSEIHSIIYPSLLDQSVSMSPEGTDARLDIQNDQKVLAFIAKDNSQEEESSVVDVTEIADCKDEKASKSLNEPDLLSEIQCMLSPDHTVHTFPEIMDDLDLNGKATVALEDKSGAYTKEQAAKRDLDGPFGSHLEGHSDNNDMDWRSDSDPNYTTGKDLLLEIQSVITADHTVKTSNFAPSAELVELDVRVDEEVDEKAKAESCLTLVYSEDLTEEGVSLETSMVEEPVDNEEKVTSMEKHGFTHEASQVQSEVNQQVSHYGTVVVDSDIFEDVVNLATISTSTESEISLPSEVFATEIDNKSLTETSHTQQEVDVVNEGQPSASEETTAIYLNEDEDANTEHRIKKENLPIIQTSCLEDIIRGQEQLLVDETGMSNAVQEEDEFDSKVPFHSTLDVSAQKSRILLLRKTSVRRRPGQRPVTFQKEPADPSPPATPPLNMGVSAFPDQIPVLLPAIPPSPESSYPAEEPTDTSNAEEPILRRKSSIRRRGQRPVTFQEELADSLMPWRTTAQPTHPTEEPRDESTISEQILHRKSSIRRHRGQHPEASGDEPVEPSLSVVMPLRMGVPNFLGGIPIPSPAMAPASDSSHSAEEPMDESATSEPMLHRKSSVRRPKVKQPETSEEQQVEPPQSLTAPLRIGVPLFPGIPVTPAPVSSHPAEELKVEKTGSEELTIKPKKGFLKHAGFGGAHPGMMQELQARLHKKKPKE